MKFCPKCGDRGDCRDSRPLKEYTRRRYFCPCGNTWTTAEFLIEEGDRRGKKVEQFLRRQVERAKSTAVQELKALLDSHS